MLHNLCIEEGDIGVVDFSDGSGDESGEHDSFIDDDPQPRFRWEWSSLSVYLCEQAVCNDVISLFGTAGQQRLQFLRKEPGNCAARSSRGSAKIFLLRCESSTVCRPLTCT